MKLQSFLNYWLPLLIYAGLIFYTSSLSIPPLPETIPYGDKIVHFIEYAILSFLFSRALILDRTNVDGRRLRFLAIILTAIYGVTDEFHQSFTPGRSSDFIDLVFNCLGAVASQAYLEVKKPKTSSSI
jgi:VanZ family protein